MMRSISSVLRFKDMRRYAFVLFLLTLGAYAREPARERSEPASTSASEKRPERETRDVMGSYNDYNMSAAYPWYILAPPSGYIVTPSGELIFPSAPPPMGDTSTLSGAGPNVSTGPVVGPGPRVSTGPEVGPDFDYPNRPVTGTPP
jgi:hypothetical protein